MQTLKIRVLSAVVAAALTSAAGAMDLSPVDREAAPHILKEALRAAKKSSVTDLAPTTPRTRWLEQSLPVSKSGMFWSPEGLARAHLALLDESLAKSAQNEFLDFDRSSTLRDGAQIVQFKTRVQGIEVFRRSVRLLIDGQQKLRFLSGLLPEFDAPSSKAGIRFDLSARDALAEALQPYGFDVAVVRSLSSEAREVQHGPYVQLALDDSFHGSKGTEVLQSARAKQVLFPIGKQLQPAWYVETVVGDIDGVDADYYAYVIDAGSGQLLYRHNQTQDADFKWNVWAETAPSFLPYPGPHGRGFIPHPTGFPSPSRPASAATNLVTLQNVPFSQNDPWLPDSASVTTGNNTEACADIGSGNGCNGADVRGTVYPATNLADPPAYDLSLAPGVSTAQREAAVRQMFYMVNWTHDWYYDAGFDEASGNAQTDNFGRGGSGGDSISAEGQDSSGTNNANMATPSDGARPRMQMYVFSAGGETRFSRNTPAPAADFVVGTAAWQSASFDLTGDVIRALDAADGAGPTTTDGCSPLNNAAAINGNIAFIDRGSCNYTVKATNAFNAGAIGMLIGNVVNSNSAGTAPGMGGTLGGGAGAMPALSLSFPDAEILRAQMPGLNGQMFRDTSIVSPDGTVDNGIMAHELGHYISNRLVEDANGLSTNHSGGMGEGYGDFHAMLFTVKDGDELAPSNPNFSGTYSFAGYTFYPQLSTAFYYGLRRYPYSTDFSKNPLTLGHIETGVPLPASPPPAFGNDNAEVHNAGEVWASMLWQCYAGLINDKPRLTFADAQQRMKDYFIAGYKLTPAAPVMTEARDAILSVMAATDIDDFLACAPGFALRGAGIDAEIPDRFGTTNAGTVENFDSDGRIELGLPQQDDDASCDADGVLDVGEAGTISIPWRNRGWEALNDSSLQISSDHADLTFSGMTSTTLSPAATNPYEDLSIVVPAELASMPAGGIITLTLQADDSGLSSTPAPLNASIRVNYDETAASSAEESFDTSIFAWNLRLTNGATSAKQWSVENLGSTTNAAHGPDAGELGVAWIETPDIEVGNSGFSVTLNHRFSFEYDGTPYDGGVVEISTNGGSTWSPIDGTPTIYNGTLSNCCGNPLAGRAALISASAGYPASFVDTTLDLGSSYNGQTVRLRFGVAEDEAAGGEGWDINTVTLSGVDNLPFPSFVAQAATCSGGANNPPSFTAGSNQSVAEDAGPQTVNTWATSITDGDGETQVLSFNVTANSNPGLFSVAPAIDASTGNLSYTPAADAFGTASITVELTDDGGGTNASAPATFDIEVTAVNDAPQIISAAVTTATEDVEYSYAPTATDVDGPEANWSTATGDTCGGSFSGGAYTFTPAGPMPSANCELAIQVCDNGSPEQCDVETATVTILATEDGDAVANDDNANVLQDSSNNLLDVLANDLPDPDDSNLNLTSVGTPAHGSASIAGSEVSYTPAPGYCGADSFDYEVNGGIAATVTVQVSCTSPDVFADGFED